MKLKNKILALLVCVPLLLISLACGCFADTGYIGNYLGDEMLVPEMIIFGGVSTGEPGQSIAISNSQYTTGDANMVEISILDTSLGEGDNQGWFHVSIYNTSNTIEFETDFDFSIVTLIYPDFYSKPNVNRVENYLSYTYDAALDDVAFLSYTYTNNYYLGDGSLMQHDDFDGFDTDEGDFNPSFNIVSIANSELKRYGFITDMVVEFDFGSAHREFGIYKHSVDDYGFGLGRRPFTNLEVIENVINPNILDWLTDSLDAFMSARIFGDITIGAILAFVVAVPMVTWFLKLVAGG